MGNSFLRSMALASVLLGAGCAGDLPEIPKALPGSAVAAQSPSTERPAPLVHTASPRATQIYVDQGLREVSAGTGFFVRQDARLLTNNHVVGKCDAVSVEIAGGSEALAKVIATDAPDDLALLRADISPPAVAIFREKVRMDGRRAFIIGYPSHGLPRIKPALTTAALVGPVLPDGRRFILKGELHPGNSGGPVLDESALVVGVVFGKINSEVVYQNTGRTIDDIGFAITNETALAFLAENGVAAATATGAQRQNNDALFEGSSQIVARVVCWRR